MGKDLKGKELGKGITQESTGLYSARFVDWFGKRKQWPTKWSTCKNKYAEIKEFIGGNKK